MAMWKARGSRDLALAILNALRFLVLDHIVSSPNLLSLHEILDCQIDVDKYYVRLQVEEGLEFSLDLRRLGLVVESNKVVLRLSPTPPPQGPVIDLTVEGTSVDPGKMNVDEATVQSPEVNVS